MSEKSSKFAAELLNPARKGVTLLLLWQMKNNSSLTN